MSDTYVIVHGAWHTGAELEATAALMRKAGHTVHCPTLAGNRPGDNKTTTGLKDAVDSLVDYIVSKDLKQVRLVGHSYGGMVISMTYDRIPDRIQRLVYVNAFVPNPGECLNDLVPPHYLSLFDEIAAANANAVMLPFPIWREAFINDADLALAESSYAALNPHPYKTFTDKAELKMPMAAAQVGKSYINCQQDTAMPHGHPWHPRLSEKLGLFRLVECQGSHEIWFTDPATIADAIVKAGRD
ncbi:alpha/beta fold hydrolase [Variovorax sp. VNK109]|uniref:alpha/beta hydrolase n=1 Tax=Variovorax sp. VNK109 TaxID=3400919 RepID=UPI003C0F34F2